MMSLGICQLVLLTVHAASATVSDPGYYLKLWGCSSDDPSKVTYQNQRWLVNATSHTINFPASGGCLTSSSSAKAAPGSALHVSTCSAACVPEQGWTFEESTGLVKSTTNPGVCIGVAGTAPSAKNSSDAGNSLVFVTAQRCDDTGRSNDVDLKWSYDAKRGHLMMSGKCIDAGQGVVKDDRGTTNRAPSGHGCLNPIAKSLPYCNSSLTVAERVADIISRMTNEEKAEHLHGSGGTPTFPGIPRIGLPAFNWGLEGLHGLRTSCVPIPNPSVCVDPNNPQPGSFACPTVFPAPTGLGATFNDTLVEEIGFAIGTEARAMNNVGTVWGDVGKMIVRTPELNLIRDPRWGRNVENPSEDPVHAGKYGAAMVSGVQRKQEGIMLAGVEMKHYAVYQAEDCGAVPAGHGPGIPSSLQPCGRMHFDANISSAELTESYFPAFRATVIASAPTGVMCSYNAINGVPACANKMLSDTIRGWGFTGYVGTDCSAADNIFHTYQFASDYAHGYASGLNTGGYDLICNPHNASALMDAVTQQFVTAEALERALTNAFTVLFQVGMFAPLKSSTVFAIGLDRVGASRHMELALDAARQSTVLLRNYNETLPLAEPQADTSIVVIGPQANATGMLGGNYFNSECASGTEIWGNASGGGGQMSWWSCVPTLFSAVQVAAGSNATVTFAQGCRQRCSGTATGAQNIMTKTALDSPDVCNAADRAEIPHAVSAAHDADVVVLGLGFDTAIAGEGHDRLDMGLPGAQEELALEVLAGARPDAKVILVLYGGASISIDALLGAARPPDAILVGHMPGVTGGTAVAEALFGKHNDFGKLPYTVYPKVYQNTTKFVEMSLRRGENTPEGRTHRFYTGTPQYSYGEGLSYTSFALSEPVASSTYVLHSADAAAGMSIQVMVGNSGAEHAGSTVVMAWFAPAAAPSAAHRSALAARLGQDPPARSLVAYKRSPSLGVGEQVLVDLQLRVDDLAFVDAVTAERVLPAGEYEIRVNLGPKNEDAGEVVRTIRVAEDIAL